MLRSRLLCTATVLIALAGSALADAETAKGLVTEAQTLVDKGDFAGALTKYEAAAKEDPDSAAATEGLASTLLGLGRVDEAIATANEGLKKHEDHPGISLVKARAYMWKADTAMRAQEDGSLILAHAADCDAALRPVLAADPDHADGNVLKAKVLQHQGGQEEALQHLMAQTKKHPKHFDTWWEIGDHWFRAAGRDNKNKELWANGEAAFRKAFEADPQSGWAIQRATLCAHWQQKDPLELATGYEQAARLLNGHDNSLKQLNACLRSQPEKRAAAFERLHDALPDNLIVTQWYAYVLRDTGKKDDAVKILRHAEKTHPKNPNVRKDLGDALRAQGKMDEAIGKYEEGLKLRDGSYLESEYKSLLDLASSDATSREQKEKIWTALWQAYPTVLWAPNNAGLYYRDVFKNPKESLKWYLRASEAAPEDPQVLNDTGLIYHYELNDLEKSIPFYVGAIRAANKMGIEPGNEGASMGFRDALNNIGLVYMRLGKWKELKQLLDEDVPPGYPLVSRVGDLLVRNAEWKQLGEFVKIVVPEDHPNRARWEKAAKEKGSK